MSHENRENWALLGRGKSSEVFRIADGIVIKIFHAAVSEEMIQREMAAARIAASLHVRTAAPLKRVSVEGRSALIYPEIAGPSLARAIRKSPFFAAEFLRRMATLQQAIHAHEVSGLRTVKSVLAIDIDYGPASARLKGAALEYLGNLPESARLLHGDFHIDNIVIHDGQLAVLDWAKAAVGDPAADVVRSEMLMHFGEGPSDFVTCLWRDWAARKLRRSYQEQSGLSAGKLALWRPVVALAWLRARPPVRSRAFHHYLNKALGSVGLPNFIPN